MLLDLHIQLRILQPVEVCAEISVDLNRDALLAVHPHGEVDQAPPHFVAHFSWYSPMRLVARSQSRKSEITGKMLGASSRR